MLTRQEQYRLTKYLLKDTDALDFGILLTLMTGLRVGEICALRWADISLKDRTISVKNTMQRIKDLTGGDSLDSNIQLVFNNARLAAQTACALCR